MRSNLASLLINVEEVSYEANKGSLSMRPGEQSTQQMNLPNTGGNLKDMCRWYTEDLHRHKIK